MHRPNWISVESSWLDALAWVPSRDVRDVRSGSGLFLVRTRAGKVYCYAAPSWVFGLALSAQARKSRGEKASVGSIVSRYLVRRFGPGLEATGELSEAA